MYEEFYKESGTQTISRSGEIIKHGSVELFYPRACCIMPYRKISAPFKESVWFSWVLIFPPVVLILGLIYSCNIFSSQGICWR